MALESISAEELRSLRTYDPETGQWKHCSDAGNGIRSGDQISLCADTNGYLTMTVKRKLYLAHRLAFLYMTGSWPPDQVDHVNGVITDNRWCNLRPASREENTRHRAISASKKTTDFKGVYKRNDRPNKQYEARIGVDGKYKSLGSYQDAAIAAWVYNLFAIALHGEFAILNELKVV